MTWCVRSKTRVVGSNSNLENSSFSYYSSPRPLLLGSNLNAGFVACHLSKMFEQSAFTLKLCTAQTNCSFCVLLVINDAVASNCRSNVTFSLKSSSKIVSLPFQITAALIWLFQKNISAALIEAYCVALNHDSTAEKLPLLCFWELM